MVPTALPAKGRIVILLGACVACGDASGATSSLGLRRNSSGSRGDSYRIDVLDLWFDLGRIDKDSMVTRSGVVSRDECSASVMRKVLVGVMLG